MHPSDKGQSKDKATSTLPRSSPLRRRLTSRLQPLHGGMGFGAGEIRERAMVVARQASQRGSSRTANTPQRPVFGPTGQGLQFTEEKTVLRELEQIPFLLDDEVSDEPSQRRSSIDQSVRKAAAQSPLRANPPVVGGTNSQVPSIKSFIAAPKRAHAPTRFQSLAAWFFDTLVVLACLVFAFTLSASVPTVSLLAHKFPALAKYAQTEAVQAGSLGWLFLMAQTLASASLILFAVQAFSGFLLSASIGRAIANVRMESYRAPFARAFKIGFAEMLQWPLAFGLLNAVVSPEHNFFVRSLRWVRASSEE
ncbi:hypothetical protein EBU99_07300 [bacterium]|nr:hypothetical protein [bacterium]